MLAGTYLNFNWQHVGRRPIDDINSSYTPQYNEFDLGFRYTTELVGKATTCRFTANNISNVHYWSTLGSGKHHGTKHRQLSGAPRRTVSGDRFGANRFLAGVDVGSLGTNHVWGKSCCTSGNTDFDRSF